MGKSQSKLSPEQLADLQKHTYFDKRELQQWYVTRAPISMRPPMSHRRAPFSPARPLCRCAQVQGLPEGLPVWAARQGRVQPPLPELKKTYEATLQTLSAIPQSSVYRQGAEALTLHRLKAVEKANGDITALEKELDEGHVEESLEIAQDELSLAAKMLEWKAWEPLEEQPQPGQWQYFGKEATATTSS